MPVRDEAALFPRLLDAMVDQRLPDGPPVVLCILLDGCMDASADVVDRYRRDAALSIVVDRVARADPNAGRARRRAMALGIRALSDRTDAALLTTDADSVPAPGWIAANLAGLTEADVVAGRIERIAEPGADAAVDAAQTRVEAYYDQLFALRRAIDPVPWEAARTHHYTSGASLAFRRTAYEALGGFPPCASGEDARIVDAAHAAGLRVRRDADVLVRTSSRQRGRAAGGLADHLSTLRPGAPITMAHPADAAWRYTRQAAARRAYDELVAGAGAGPLASMLGIDAASVASTLAEARNAEAFAMRVVPDPPWGMRTVTLDEAEIALDALTRNASQAGR